MLTTFAILGLTLVHAQDGSTTTGVGFTKGDAFISGSFGFSTSSSGDTKGTTFSVSPRVGYFVSEKFAIGARVGYQNASQEFGTNETDSNTFTIGAFGRYYFTAINKFSIFGELGIANNNTKIDIDGVENKTNGFGVNVRPGINYFLNSNFALEMTIGAISYNTVNPDQGDSADLFNIGLNLDNIFLGLVYKF